MGAMETFSYRPGTPSPYRGGAVALGFFDGVHAGHRALLAETVRIARASGVPAGVLTFRGEDARMKPGQARLYPTEERLALIAGAGADFAAVCDFADMADMTPAAFVGEVLLGDFAVRSAVCGYNFRFGRGACADSAVLCDLLRRGGAAGHIIGEQTAGGEPLSASGIRKMITAGRMEDANRALVVPYHLAAEVTRGRHIGSGQGCPTLNTAFAPGILTPREGVYASVTEVRGERFPSVTNIGVCPTFGRREPHAETHLMDFAGELYGERVRVYLLSFLRPEREFPSAQALYEQIGADIAAARERVRKNEWLTSGQKLPLP